MSCVSLAGHEQHSNFPQVWTVRENGLANRGTYTCESTISWWACHLSSSASRMSSSQQWHGCKICQWMKNPYSRDGYNPETVAHYLMTSTWKEVSDQIPVCWCSHWPPSSWAGERTLLFTRISLASFRKSLFTPGTKQLVKAIFWAKLRIRELLVAIAS